jgi:uncharacterized protein
MKMKKSMKKMRKSFMNVVSINNTPHSIALGFAIGTFIAIFPTMGLDIPIAFLVALLYKKVNKLSLFGSFIFWNPIFSIPIMMLSYQIGDFLFGSFPVTAFDSSLLNHLLDFGRRFAVGLAICAVFISIISYFLVRMIAEIYQRRQKVKLSAAIIS